jgi:hypothetical protein
MESYSLQYISDIHLEKDSSISFSNLLNPSAVDLALCGDIGDPYSPIYEEFLKWCSTRWNRVFLISGNHEYFLDRPDINKTVEKIDEHIKHLCKKVSSNVYFLQKDVVLIDTYKIAIIGATLWSAPDLRIWDRLTSGFIGDPGLRGEYNAIFKRDENTNMMRPYHPIDITSLHMEHKYFISKMLGPFETVIPADYRVIVLTHHLPSFSMNPPEFALHPLCSCYASAMDAMIKEPVVAWLCGHSHNPITARFDSGTLVSLNPVGYKNESKSDFSKTAHIVIYRENIAIRRI